MRIFHISPDGKEEFVAKLVPYDFFGEMALFKDAPRFASVETLEDTEVVILRKKEFYKLVAENERIGRTLSEEYFAREQANLLKARAQETT